MSGIPQALCSVPATTEIAREEGEQTWERGGRPQYSGMGGPGMPPSQSLKESISPARSLDSCFQVKVREHRVAHTRSSGWVGEGLSHFAGLGTHRRACLSVEAQWGPSAGSSFGRVGTAGW